MNAFVSSDTFRRIPADTCPSSRKQALRGTYSCVWWLTVSTKKLVIPMTQHNLVLKLFLGRTSRNRFRAGKSYCLIQCEKRSTCRSCGSYTFRTETFAASTLSLIIYSSSIQSPVWLRKVNNSKKMNLKRVKMCWQIFVYECWDKSKSVLFLTPRLMLLWPRPPPAAPQMVPTRSRSTKTKPPPTSCRDADFSCSCLPVLPQFDVTMPLCDHFVFLSN